MLLVLGERGASDTVGILVLDARARARVRPPRGRGATVLGEKKEAAQEAKGWCLMLGVLGMYGAGRWLVALYCMVVFCFRGREF